MPMDRAWLLEFARRLPKAELHVHLEGSIRPSTLLELARRNGVPLPAQDEAGLADYYRFSDFAHFITVYTSIIRSLHTPDDYELIAYEFGAGCARQNIRYAEVTFTILSDAHASGLPWQTVLEALNRGRARARREFGVDWQWVFDINRNRPETAMEVVEIALAAREQGVVALGLGGSEDLFPPELFAAAFDRARDAGLHRVPHTGELNPPASVWTAIRLLHPERLGHGVRSSEDPALVDYLREHRIALELCPTSNICLGLYPGYAAHPFRQLWDAGALVTVNSDDPPMFGADLSHEYEIVVTDFGFDAQELEELSLNGVRASFLPAKEQARLETEFRSEFGRLRRELS